MSAQRKKGVGRFVEQVRTVPGLAKDVGSLAVLILAAIVATAGIQAYLNTSFPWDDEFTLLAEFEATPGLNPDATTHQVNIAGVRVGDIADYEPTDRGTAIVTMKLRPAEIGPIHENARALLRPKNALNDMMITIYPGGPPAPQLQDGATIPIGQTQRPTQINEVLQNLDGRAQTAIEDLMVASDTALARAPQQLPGGFKATDQTLDQLRPAMDALAARRENLARLSTALGRIATAFGGDRERALRLANASNETLKVIAENDRDLVATFNQFPELSDKLRSALGATQELTDQLDPTLDNLSRAQKELPDALDEFKDTAHSLGKTVDEADGFVDKLKPVVADLKPFVHDADSALEDLVKVTENLDDDTDAVTTYLNVIRPFFYNTSSVFGAGDGQGGNIRGHVLFRAPDATHLFPGGDPGYAPGPEGGVVPGKPLYGRTPIPGYVPGSESRNDPKQASPNMGLPEDIRDGKRGQN